MIVLTPAQPRKTSMTTYHSELCEHCGAKIVEYKHGLGKNLMRCLVKLVNAGGGPLSISDDLKLTKSQYTNFAKLAYWGLVVKANPKGGERGGMWAITDEGWRFVRGKEKIQKYACVYRGDVVRRLGPMLSVTDITDDRWKYRPEYAREAVPHDPNKPPDLFSV